MTSGRVAIDRLRSATRAAHAQLEADADVMRRLSSPSERACLVAGYRRLYSTAADLLGDGPPTLGCQAEALGFRYVIEGSALGGRLILKALEDAGVDIVGLEFLNPNGARTGAAWRDFMALLETELAGDPAALDRAEAGAVKGFDLARRCLCPNGVWPGNARRADAA